MREAVEILLVEDNPEDAERPSPIRSSCAAPKIDGLEVLRRLKREARTKSIPGPE